MSSIQTCRDSSDAVEMCAELGLYLKTIARLNVSIQLPQMKTPGRSISSWEVMEKLRQAIKPDEFTTLKISKTTLEFIRFEGEVENRSSLKAVIARLENGTIKLSGFPDNLRVRAAEAKVPFPTRHDWDSHFRDAKGTDEMKPGERPDTVYVQGLPCKWFADKRHDADRPSEVLVRQAFGGPGPVRRLDIPLLDPCHRDAEVVGRISTFSFSQELTFDVYVQYMEYMGFVKAMDSLRGMKLMLKTPEGRAFTANIKVDFDRSGHLSDESIQRRQQERLKLEALEKEREERVLRERLQEERAREAERRRVREEEEQRERRRQEKQRRREERRRRQELEEQQEAVQRKRYQEELRKRWEEEEARRKNEEELRRKWEEEEARRKREEEEEQKREEEEERKREEERRKREEEEEERRREDVRRKREEDEEERRRQEARWKKGEEAPRKKRWDAEHRRRPSRGGHKRSKDCKKRKRKKREESLVAAAQAEGPSAERLLSEPECLVERQQCQQECAAEATRKLQATHLLQELFGLAREEEKRREEGEDVLLREHLLHQEQVLREKLLRNLEAKKRQRALEAQVQSGKAVLLGQS